MHEEFRSQCPVNLSLEAFGDRWTLLVLRDITFGGRRHFRELLQQSEEGISSSILADRLKVLVEEGFLTRAGDPGHKQKGIYSLTEKAIQLLPVFAALGTWGRRHLPVSPELSWRAEALEQGGPDLWARLMDRLRDIHLRGAPGGPLLGPP
jgi:DNA-binding HxlR family transcriptional regulator